jgi:hypothetical protein
VKSKETETGTGLNIFRDAVSGFSNVNQTNMQTFGNLENAKMELEKIEVSY